MIATHIRMLFFSLSPSSLLFIYHFHLVLLFRHPTNVYKEKLLRKRANKQTRTDTYAGKR